MVENLRDRGYQVMVAVDTENACTWVSQCSDPPDIILSNQVRQTTEATLETACAIRQKLSQPSRTAIVIMAENYGSDLEGLNVDRGDNTYITYLADAQQLFNLLEQLVSQTA